MHLPNPCIAIAIAIAFSAASRGQDVAKPGGRSQPERTIAEEIAVLEKGRLSARKNALARLGVHPEPAADAVLRTQFERYNSRDLPPALWLELFEAMAKRNSAELKTLLDGRNSRLAKSPDPLRRFEECLEGGSGEEGRAIFNKKPEAGCIRCHTIDAKGGRIGPDLTWLRHAIDRAHILESIISPNSVVAPGFESVALKLKDGGTLAGVVRAETAEEITLGSFADGKPTTVKLLDVIERTVLPSPMPPHFGQVLDRRAIRDLVEFIAAGD